MKISWSPLSLHKIDEIAHYIAKDKPEAAKRWITSIFKSVERLKSFPYSGRTVPEINRIEIQELIFGNHRIIYRIDKQSIHILTVRHSKQSLSHDELVN